MRWVVMDKDDNIIEICDNLSEALEKYDRKKYQFVPELDSGCYLLGVSVV